MSTINNISLYIPHVFANYSKEDIARVFEKYVGSVKNIDLVSKIGKDGKAFNAAYIHFHSWQNDIATRNFQERVLDPNLEARIVYDDPWYWICLENKSRKVDPSQRKPRLDLGDSSTFATTNAGYLTPPPKERNLQTPGAPARSKSENRSASKFTDAEMEELEAAIDAEEAAIQSEDQYLVSVDSRYIQTMEEENMALRNSCALLQARLMGCYY